MKYMVSTTDRKYIAHCLDLLNKYTDLCDFTVVFHRLWPLFTSWSMQVKTVSVLLSAKLQFWFIGIFSVLYDFNKRIH